MCSKDTRRPQFRASSFVSHTYLQELPVWNYVGFIHVLGVYISCIRSRPVVHTYKVVRDYWYYKHT